MKFEIVSSRQDMQRESVYFFSRTCWGGAFYLIFGLTISVVGYFIFFGGSASGGSLFQEVVNFIMVFVVVMLLLPLAYFYQLYGGHVSAHWNDTTEREITVENDAVTFDGKTYPIGQVSVSKEKGGFFLVLGRIKVILVSRKNCSGYDELRQLLA